MERIELEAFKREVGKGNAKKARREKLIPAVLYGKEIKQPVLLNVNEKKIEQAVKTQAGMNVLMDLVVDGTKHVTRIREFQAHPLSRNFTHLDFQTVDLKQKILVEVPIQIEGKSKGVAEGGVLVIDRRTLEIKCFPTAIPEHIKIDITELEIGDGIHINDLKLPEGAECVHDINFAIVSVVAPVKEEVVVATEAVPVEGAAATGAVPGAAPGTAAPTAGAAGAKPAGGAAPATAAGAKPAGGAAPKAATAAKEKK